MSAEHMPESVSISDPEPPTPTTDETAPATGLLHHWAIPAVAGTAGGIGLALLTAHGGMPVKAAYAVVVIVAAWTVVVVAVHVYNHVTTSRNEETP